jgi:hypothetical protein
MNRAAAGQERPEIVGQHNRYGGPRICVTPRAWSLVIDSRVLDSLEPVRPERFRVDAPALIDSRACLD